MPETWTRFEPMTHESQMQKCCFLDQHTLCNTLAFPNLPGVHTSSCQGPQQLWHLQCTPYRWNKMPNPYNQQFSFDLIYMLASDWLTLVIYYIHTGGTAAICMQGWQLSFLPCLHLHYSSFSSFCDSYFIPGHKIAPSSPWIIQEPERLIHIYMYT